MGGAAEAGLRRELQQQFSDVHADPACTPIADAYLSPDSVDLRLAAYFTGPAPYVLALHLYMGGDTSSYERVVRLHQTQAPLISQCDSKYLRKSFPDMTRTSEPSPVDGGITGSSAVLSRSTLDSDHFNLHRDGMAMFVATGSTLLMVSSAAPRDAFVEADFLKIAELATQRLAIAMTE